MFATIDKINIEIATNESPLFCCFTEHLCTGQKSTVTYVY